MLAIMNVGKYATAPLPPGGEVIITKLSSQSVGITVNQFEKHGNTIIGIEYNSIGYVISTDNGETWQYEVTDYPIGGVCYSDTLEGWCFIEGLKRNQSGELAYTIHKGFSTDGTSIMWSELESGESTASTVSIPIAFLGHFVKQAGAHVIYAFALYGSDNSSQQYYRLYNELGDIVATYETDKTSFVKSDTGYFFKTKNYMYYKSSSSSSKPYVFSISGVDEVSAVYTVFIGCNNEVFYGSNGDPLRLGKDPRVAPTDYDRPTPCKGIVGYFEISNYVYVFTSDSYIARANSLVDACLLENSAYTSLSDIGVIRTVLNLTDRKCLVASSGSIYLCEIK